ncbi:MAG: hypothetical protein V2A73_14000 [Pseudomonadota bacterium]
MRRLSDRQHGERTGYGRRARDRILSEQAALSPTIAHRFELANMLLFLGDDLRESALALGGIEAFLLEAQRILEKPDLTEEDLQKLLEHDDVLDRIDLLEDALSSLRRSIGLVHGTLKEQSGHAISQ